MYLDRGQKEVKVAESRGTARGKSGVKYTAYTIGDVRATQSYSEYITHAHKYIEKINSR